MFPHFPRPFSTFFPEAIHPHVNDKQHGFTSSHRILRAFLRVLFPVILQVPCACIINVEAPSGPSAPSWVVQSPPFDCPVKGIRPGAGTNTITLEWYSIGDEEITRYELRRAVNQEQEFQLIAIIPLQDRVPDTTFQDKRVSIDSVYFYILFAIDREGNKSEPSDTLSFRLLQKPALHLPLADQTMTEPPTFSWSIHPVESPAIFYILEIRNADSGTIFCTAELPRRAYGAPQSFTITESVLQEGRDYHFRVFAFGQLDQAHQPRAGSVSAWRRFRIEQLAE